MFNQEDLGRKIRVKNVLGHSKIKVGYTYTISCIYNESAIRLNDDIDWVCTDDKAYVFQEDTFDLLECGDEVILLNSTTTLKRGSRLKIKEFLDTKRKKIVTYGILPGGWINSEHVVKLIDPNKYRIKNLQEIILDFGIDFYNIIGINKFVFSIMGRALSELKFEQKDKYNIKLDDKYNFPIQILTETKNKPLECKLVIVDKYELEKHGVTKKFAEELAGVDVVNLFQSTFGLTYASTSEFGQLFHVFAKAGFANSDTSFPIQISFIKLDLDIKAEEKKRVHHTIPF